jgi:hypothetical protein
MSKSIRRNYEDLMNAELSPIKKNIRIVNRRFPVNFFNVEESRKLYSSTSTNPSDLAPVPHQVPLQNYDSNRRRDSLTARDSMRLTQEEDLILGVISTTRKMKRVLRKHSLELKNSMNMKNNPEFELPPLTVRKGVSTAF